MKKSQIVFLGIAVVAGGAAFMVKGGSKPADPAQPQAVQAPQMEIDDVLIASRDIPLGTVISEADMGWQQWPRAAVGIGMIRKSDDPRLVTDLKGSVARGSFILGEPIRREKLVKGANTSFMAAILPSGQRAVAINIDTQGSTTAGGFILPNDRVDVIRTYRDEEAAKSGSADAYVTETLLTNVRVLAIGQNIQEKNGERVVVGSNATLELDPHQAEIIVLAQRVGQLSLTLRSLLDFNKTADAPGADQDRGDKSMSVVRYGVVNALAKR
jgi:pilus assembly protein CpaB